MSYVEFRTLYSLLIGILATSITIFGILLIFLCRKKAANADEDTESTASSPPVTKPCAPSYQLMEIDAATDGFNHRRIVGKGRIGTVYAAVTPKGEVVAVKRIHPRLVLNNAGFGFSSILKTLSLADHPHVVPITGFSEAPGERIIVMEFGGMLSLEFYLHQNTDGVALLDWRRRLRIAAGAARGLEYLHEEVAPPIIHGCVKPSNILIDVKLCARLCDYGLHFLAPEGLAGGYVDEECWREGKGVSKECDVYGFGVVLMELLSGRGSADVVEWGLPLVRGMRIAELLDPRLAVPADVGPLVRLSKVALACVANSRKNRPSMRQVAAILSSIEMAL
ncbi:serine/threonine-protein kinase-like protein CCR2 [Salvia hispanica]|uniref:serine/threonine-protein kinase-like protein CCR2 n=1 Tax=Salvia hispanica TaxID=49212 RepID=UPI00200902D3|nr:serine/threonine-protein kinase-like protein CCR2 [Salvia hispanica]